MTIQPGQTVPEIPVKLVTSEGVKDASSTDVLGEGTVVLFSVPGAFTPTCHLNHLPGFLAAAEKLRDAGVDRIVCAAVNDHHVVKAWAEAAGALGTVDFIADGGGELARALGLERDMGGVMGVRFKRSALIFKDGVAKLVNSEAAPGEVTASGAPAILEALKTLS